MSTRALGVSLILVLASCGQTETSTQSSSPTSSAAAVAPAPASSYGKDGPCSWLTDAEVSELLGQPSKSSIDKENKNCNVDPADANGKVKLYYRVADNTGAYSFMHAFKDSQVFTNLGDKAVWSNGGLAAVKGKRCVNIGISATKGAKVPEADLQQQAARVAHAIIERM